MKPVTRSHIFLSLFFCLCIIFLACKKNNISAPVLSANKVITSFNLNQADNAGYLSVDVIGSVGTDTIILTIPLETDRTNLKPNITFTGKSINPSSAVAQNFSSPLIYTVTAEDGSTKKYTVLVTYRSTVYFCTH